MCDAVVVSRSGNSELGFGTHPSMPVVAMRVASTGSTPPAWAMMNLVRG